MGQEEMQEFSSPLPVLPRLDRLDRLEITCAAESCARISKVERGTGDGSQWDANARYPQQLGKNQFSLASSASCSFHEALLV